MRVRWTWLTLGALLLAAAGAAVLVPLLRSATSGEPATSSSLHLLACAQQDRDDHCRRIADDRAARTPLSSVDQTDATRFAERLRAAFETHLGAQCQDGIDACVFPQPPTAESLRAALDKAALPGPVVRQVRITDPAPLGATIYAIRAGAGCVVGWVQAGAGGSPQVVGRLPGGTCLPE
ncbi:hypothetical protein [Phytohabitans suffuscus]